MATSTILRQPVLVGNGWVADLSDGLRDCQASKQWMGGYWQYSFTLGARADRPDEISRLQSAFQDWLGYHVERVRDNTVVWEGFIAQMDFAYGRVRRRRSLVDGRRPVWNAIRATYDDDGTPANTAWYTDTASIARYGRIEKTLTTNNYTLAEAQNLAQMWLAARAWPQPFAIAISNQSLSPVLDVLACGYWITAAWQESAVELPEGGAVISAVVESLVGGDCPFLSVGNIANNDFTVTALTGKTAAARMAGLLELGDAGLTSYRAWVGPGRRFYYQPVDYAVDYRLMPDGLRQRLAGPLLAPDMVQPGVVRDEGWPGVWPLPAGNFADGRDMLVTEVTVSQGAEEPGDLPELRTAEVDEADIYAAQLAQEMER